MKRSTEASYNQDSSSIQPIAYHHNQMDTIVVTRRSVSLFGDQSQSRIIESRSSEPQKHKTIIEKQKPKRFKLPPCRQRSHSEKRQRSRRYNNRSLGVIKKDNLHLI